MEASRSCTWATAPSGLCIPWATQSVSLPCSRLPSIRKKCGLRSVHRNAVTVFRCVDSRAAQQRICDDEDKEAEASASGSESGSDEELDVDSLSSEEIDALMKEYGNVVRSEPEPGKQVTDEAVADKEGLAFVMALAKVANEAKAENIKVLHVKPLVYWTRYFLIASAFSMPQLNAIGQRMEELAEQKFNTKVRGNTRPSSWTLLDFGDVVVHIFLPAEREYYDLEEFYGNAPLVELPFETERR